LEKKKGCTAQKETGLVEQREAPALAVHTVILFEGHRDPVPNNEQKRVSPLSAIRAATSLTRVRTLAPSHVVLLTYCLNEI
jgi:hypothetical protein